MDAMGSSQFALGSRADWDRKPGQWIGIEWQHHGRIQKWQNVRIDSKAHLEEIVSFLH